jgi:hypothetical protein
MNSLVRSFLGLLVVLCASAPAHSAEATKATKSSSASSSNKNFEISWTRAILPEEAFAREQLESLRQRHSAGLATTEELSQITYQLKIAEGRAPYLLTIRSKGGTLKEFFDVAAASSNDVALTVINAGDPADLDVKLPLFELRNAGWGTVISVLANFLATRGLQLNHAGGDNPNPSEARSVVCVLRPTDEARALSRFAQPEFEAFQLAPYMIESPQVGGKAQDVNVIVEAIWSAWSMTGAQMQSRSAFEWSDKHLRMKYHPATKMLFVSGPPNAIAIARQVISNLPKNAGYK